MKRYLVSAGCILNILFVIGLSALLSGCGCGRDGEEGVPGQEQVELAQAAFEELRQELIAMDKEEDQKGIVARLRTALEDEQLAPFDSRIFAWLIGQLVATEEGLIEAKALYLQAVEDNEDRVRDAYGIVANAYLRLDDRAGAMAWCRELLGKQLPQEVSTRIWLRVVQLNIEDENFDACLADVPTVVGTLSPVNAERVLWLIVSAELKAKQFDQAKKLLHVVQRMELTDERLIRFQRLANVDMLVAEGRPVMARDLLLSQWQKVPDADLARRLGNLLDAFSAAGQVTEMDELGEFALTKLAEKQRSQKRVVTGWIKAASDAGDRSAFIRRMTAADTAGMPVGMLMGVVAGGFYDTIASGTDAECQACVAMAEKLQARVPADDKSTAKRLATLRLDGAFYKEDFKTALSVIDAGVPGEDEDWHKVLRNKIGAHLALNEGRTDDAIALFREHMKTVEGWEQPQMNPRSGIRMHKEAVLGFNEKRIGDIYKGAGRADDAKAAYDRACAHYKQAIESVKADSKEAAAYKEELAQVPVEE